jgi:hypothetical protein
MIETQEDRDYVFEHIKITSLDHDPRIEVSIAKLGYLWKHIYNPRKYLEACLNEAPDVFYLHISYAPYYDLARKIMGDGVIPPLPGTNPKKIEKNPEEGIVYGNVVVNPDTTM